MNRAAAKITGVILAVLTVFTLISTFSYLFHWQEDMSLLASAVKESDPANAGGMLGLRLGDLLIARWFGLGSFALAFILAVCSVKLFIGKPKGSLLPLIIKALAYAIMTSLTLAYIGNLAGAGNLFGGGLGGRCGAYVIDKGITVMGVFPTALVLLLLLICLLFLSSRKFSGWVSGKLAGGSEDEESSQESTEDDGRHFKRRKGKKDDTDVEPIDIGIGDWGRALPKDSQSEPDPEPQPKPALQPVEGGVEVIQGVGLNTVVEEELKPIDNRLDPPDGLPKFKFPSLDLLNAYESSRRNVSHEELNRNNAKIRAVLANYKIQVADVKAQVGPTVTLYKVYPAPGVTLATIKARQEDIAMSLGARGVRVVQLIDSVGIEVANDFPSIVPLKALMNSDAFRDSKANLPVAIGYTITQEVKVFDLTDAPHLLVAGATQQGKSVGLNVIVTSLLYAMHPSELKFVFIDPKMVEFSAYAGLIKHYLAVLPDAGDEEDEKNNAIVKIPKNAERILKSLCIEMDDRYKLFEKAGVNSLKLYNKKYKDRKLNPENGHRFLPYLVVVVDEYADLTMSTGASPEGKSVARSITNSIIRLAQKGRAAGLHVILATQRPSVDVISGAIKSNFPMRIAFRVASRVDSQTILDSPGAEKLIGKGDMLFSAGIDNERIQCGFVSGDEIDKITAFIAGQTGYGHSYSHPYYLPSVDENNGEGGGTIDMSDLDERFVEAARMVVISQKGSTSDLQRKLGMGYAKAGRVMDQLQAAGIVGPQEGSKPRQVLISDLDSLEELLSHFVK